MEYVFENGLVYAVEETTIATGQTVTSKFVVAGVYYNSETNEFEEPAAGSDKTTIKADGADIATITANVPAVLNEVTFYNADINEPITTVQVDPATHTATLQVTATTPGVIKIRAGEPTITRLNEVVINAT